MIAAYESSVYGLQGSRTVELVIPQDIGKSRVILGYRALRAAIDHEPLPFPGFEIKRACEAGSIADAVPADKGHPIPVVVEEEERAIHCVAVEFPLLIRGRYYEFF